MASLKAAEERLPTDANIAAGRQPKKLSRPMLIGAVLGPVLGAIVWSVPFAPEPARHSLAVVVFMIVYWIAEPMDHGVTAMLGCFSFWALGIVKFETAFAGFSNDTPWFLFGAMLMGEAASRSGLSRRIGFLAFLVPFYWPLLGLRWTRT